MAARQEKQCVAVWIMHELRRVGVIHFKHNTCCRHGTWAPWRHFRDPIPQEFKMRRAAFRRQCHNINLHMAQTIQAVLLRPGIGLPRGHLQSEPFAVESDAPLRARYNDGGMVNPA